jgi:hypothetical protein
MRSKKGLTELHSHSINVKQLIILTLIGWLITVSNSSYASPAGDEVFGAFEWFCLSHLEKPTEIPTLFSDIGIKVLPEAKARPFLGPQTGKVWFVAGSYVPFIVSLTDKGTCTVGSPSVDGRLVEELFKKYIRYKEIREESYGIETQRFYAVTFPDAETEAETHAIVMITLSKLESLKGISLNSIPESQIKEEGIAVPKWP